MSRKLIPFLVIIGITGTLPSIAQHWMVPNNCFFSLGNSLTYRTSISVTSVHATTAQLGLEWRCPIREKYNFSFRIAPGLQTPAYTLRKSMRFFTDVSLMGHYSLTPKFEVSMGLSVWKNFYRKPNAVGESYYHEWELETKNSTQIGGTVAVRYQLTKKLSAGLAVTYFPRIYALAIENQLEKYVAFRNTSPQLSIHYNLSTF